MGGGLRQAGILAACTSFFAMTSICLSSVL